MMELQRVSLHFVPSDGQTWAEYIGLKLQGYSTNCELCDFTATPSKNHRDSKVNVFFITPDFLEHQNWQVLHTVKSSSCVLVLTGTEHADLEHVLDKKVKNAQDFFIHEMEQTEESVQDLLVLIISKYEEEDNPDSPRQTIAVSTSLPAVSTSLPSYSVLSGHLPDSPGQTVIHSATLPRDSRLTEDETDNTYHTLPPARQVNSLQDVLYKDGIVYVLLRRRAEGKVTVQIKDHNISPHCEEYAVYTIPYEGNDSTAVSVLHDGNPIGKSVIKILQSTESSKSNTNKNTTPNLDLNSKSVKTLVTDSVLRTVTVETQTDQTDPWFETADPPPCRKQTHDSTYVNIGEFGPEDDIFESTSLKKNRLEQIREILEEETDPEKFLCRCLGIEYDIKSLDEKMSSMVQRMETLRRLSYSSRQLTRQGKENSVWPTLVHFGAEYNLQNFCDVLLSNPLMWDACVLTNRDGKMPHDIAEMKGHHDLANMLRRFTEFVKNERERDSGFSGFSSTPRFSLSSRNSDPPTPHRTSDSSGYVQMEEADRRTIIATDSDVEPESEQYQKKDIGKLLGMKDEDAKEKSKPSFLNKFLQKKGRSKSEPMVIVEGLSVLRSKDKHPSLQRDSARSSSTSSSTASTLSDKEEIAEVKTRKNKKTFFGNKKTKGFLKNAKRRESVRIRNALDDRHAELPSLPGLPSRHPRFAVTHDVSEHF